MEKLLSFMKRVRSKIFTTIIRRTFHSIGRHTTIISPLRFGNLDRVKVGSFVTIHSNCWIQVLDIAAKEAGPAIEIGDNVGIGMNSTISAAKKIIIEDYVFTARNFYVSDHGHKFQDIDVPIALQGVDNIMEVRIGRGTWLAQNVIILPGVTIGRHCVIGANSVVNSDIPDFSVAVGSPARVVRKYDKETGQWVRVS